MDKLLARYGPWALVTGASSGIGAEFARQLAAKGFHLAVVARRAERLDQLRSQLTGQHPIKVEVIVADLSQPDFLPAVQSVTDGLDVGLLVNNAGFSVTGDFLEQDVERHLELLHVNCRAPMILAHEYGKRMKARGKGGIIFVASIVGFVASPAWSNYAASKAYALLLSEGLHAELAAYGVDVLALCPGTTRTEFQRVAGTNEFLAMEADRVVELALRSIGRRMTVIAGVPNRLVALGSRFMPRSVNLKIARLIVDRLRR